MISKINKLTIACIIFVLATCCFSFKVQSQTTTSYLKTFEVNKDTYLKIPEVKISDSVVSSAYKNYGSQYQFNITLNKPLDSNIVSLPIETKGLEFYPQPELDKELNVKDYDFVNATHAMIKDKVVEYRPLNVVGSVAVYKSNPVNGELGKLYHIYTPLIIDAKGQTSWAKLEVSKTQLNIVIDKEFLKTATYPITVDPTIGYTELGGTSSTNSGVANKVLYTVTSAGTMNTVSVYVSCSSSAQTIHAGIYNGTTLLSNLTQSINTFTGWLSFDIADFSFANSSTFGLGVKLSGAITIYRDTTGTANQHQQDQGLTAGEGLPGTFQVDAQTNWQFSLFANYTETLIPIESVSVALNQPINASTINTFACNFNYTPTLIGADHFHNASLIINGSSVAKNSSALINATLNTIAYTFASNGTYLWNIQVFNSTHSVYASNNFTLTVEVYEASEPTPTPTTTPTTTTIGDLTTDEAAAIGLFFGLIALVLAVALPVAYRRKQKGND